MGGRTQPGAAEVFTSFRFASSCSEIRLNYIGCGLKFPDMRKVCSRSPVPFSLTAQRKILRAAFLWCHAGDVFCFWPRASFLQRKCAGRVLVWEGSPAPRQWKRGMTVFRILPEGKPNLILSLSASRSYTR